MFKRLLLAILNTDAPTLLRMRVWIPALVVLIVLAWVLVRTLGGSGSSIATVSFAGPGGSYGVSAVRIVTDTSLGSTTQVEVQWIASVHTPELAAKFEQARRQLATQILGPSASALLPKTEDWGASPLRLSGPSKLIEIRIIAEWIQIYVLYPLLLACIVIAILRRAQRLWLHSAPVLWASGTCPTCNYVIGLGGLTTCPECGTSYSTPSPEPKAAKEVTV